MWRKQFQRAKLGLLDLFYPRLCWACNAVIADASFDFCQSCRHQLKVSSLPACCRCGASVGPFVDTSNGCHECRDQKSDLDGVIRFGMYADLLRTLILRMKYPGGVQLAEALGEYWAKQQFSAFSPLNFQEIEPGPLHFWRRIKRSFNQSERLAYGLKRGLGYGVISRHTRKKRATVSQTELSQAQRLKNVMGTFECRPKASLQGKRILLVDDVMTTGATLRELAKCLKSNGASAVFAAVLARPN